MNLGAAYAHLSTDQLRAMLDAAKRDYVKQLEVTRLKWGVEVTALKKALTQRMAQAAAEIQTLKNNNTCLQREVDAVHEELLKANSLITDQQRKLAAHDRVVELEQRLSIARRAAS
jgi:hypothetical protein